MNNNRKSFFLMMMNSDDGIFLMCCVTELKPRGGSFSMGWIYYKYTLFS